MKISGQKYTMLEMLTAMAYDKLAWLQWAKTKSGANGVNMPKPLALKLFGDEPEQDVEGFSSACDFETERQRLIGGE